MPAAFLQLRRNAEFWRTHSLRPRRNRSASRARARPGSAARGSASRATRSSSSGIPARGCRSSRWPTSARPTRCGGRARRRRPRPRARRRRPAGPRRPPRAGPTSCARSWTAWSRWRPTAAAWSRGSTSSSSAAARPPWISGLAQGTALQALTRDSHLTRRPEVPSTSPRAGSARSSSTPPSGSAPRRPPARAATTSSTRSHPGCG